MVTRTPGVASDPVHRVITTPEHAKDESQEETARRSELMSAQERVGPTCQAVDFANPASSVRMLCLVVVEGGGVVKGLYVTHGVGTDQLFLFWHREPLRKPLTLCVADFDTF